MIIVIDGPAGSGKSSTARAVADKMGIEYIDSGALYRALTLLYLKSEEDPESFFALLEESSISFRYENGLFRVFMNGDEVTGSLRSMEVAEKVSEVAAIPESRAHVNRLMRDAVDNGRYIAEGRDLGTAVFPDADLKIFMSADVEERARRRFEEQKANDPDSTLEEVKQNILDRDTQDSRREADPLKMADDAVEIDTTDLNFEQQVQQICLMAEKLIDNQA